MPRRSNGTYRKMTVGEAIRAMFSNFGDELLGKAKKKRGRPKKNKK